MTKLRGKAAPAYGTGRSESLRSGYVRVRAVGHPLAGSDGYVYEHRKVLFDAGVDIPPGFHVHHLNHDRADNRLENLAVVSNGQHHREHHPVGAVVRNQYGTFAVLTDEERLERRRAKARENQRKRRAGLRYDKVTGLWR